MGNKLGRPTGRFALQKEKLYLLLKDLAVPYCYAGNKWLAKALKCSKRQIVRYLLALKQEGRIVAETIRCRDEQSGWYMQRKVWLGDPRAIMAEWTAALKALLAPKVRPSGVDDVRPNWFQMIKVKLRDPLELLSQQERPCTMPSPRM